jgi:hypothetical protein
MQANKTKVAAAITVVGAGVWVEAPRAGSTGSGRTERDWPHPARHGARARSVRVGSDDAVA